MILALVLAIAQALFPFPGGKTTGGGSSPSIKQSALSTTDGVFTATFPSHTAGGLTCVHALLQTLTAPTISNTAGWSWGSPVSYTADPGATGYGIWTWCTATLADASSDTVTVTSGAFHGGIVAVDISNVTAIDNSLGNGSGSFSNPTTGSFTLTGTNDMAFGIARGNGGLVVPTGYTSLTASGTGFWGSETYVEVVYKVVTISPLTITWGGGDNPWAVLGVAVK